MIKHGSRVTALALDSLFHLNLLKGLLCDVTHLLSQMYTFFFYLAPLLLSLQCSSRTVNFGVSAPIYDRNSKQS